MQTEDSMVDSSFQEYQSIVDAEWKILYDKLEKIHQSGAKVVLSKLPIGDVATQYFADRCVLVTVVLPVLMSSQFHSASPVQSYGSFHKKPPVICVFLNRQTNHRFQHILCRALLFHIESFGENKKRVVSCPVHCVQRYVLRGSRAGGGSETHDEGMRRLHTNHSDAAHRRRARPVRSLRRGTDRRREVGFVAYLCVPTQRVAQTLLSAPFRCLIHHSHSLLSTALFKPQHLLSVKLDVIK